MSRKIGDLFSFGDIHLTKRVKELMKMNPRFVHRSLTRHLCGDWGDIHPDDVGLNSQAIIEGSRIFSVYRQDIEGESITLWIITEADRSITTVLFPDEY